MNVDILTDIEFVDKVELVLSGEQKNNGFLRSSTGGKWVNVTSVILLALTVKNGQEVCKAEGNIFKPHSLSVTTTCRPNERIAI